MYALFLNLGSARSSRGCLRVSMRSEASTTVIQALTCSLVFESGTHTYTSYTRRP